MNVLKKLLSLILASALAIAGSYAYIAAFSGTVISAASFDEKIKAFPSSYQTALKKLHATYPNWEFIADTVDTPFADAVAAQSENMRKQVQTSQSISWRSMGKGSYDWDKSQWVNTNGGWTGASREIIAYYMDPRNFLNDGEIYMFMEQSYNSSFQTEDGLKKIIKGTFLEKGYTDSSDKTYGGSYVKIIMDAAKQSGVSPYVIASKIIQEQGSDGKSSLISGTYSSYKGYYNFFNIGASGSSEKAVIENGLKRAKEEKWDTRAKSIIGGAEFLNDSYISAKQDTYYYQDYNVLNSDRLWHQYAQAVHDAYNKGTGIAKTYKADTSLSLSFKIPVFKNMPSSASKQPAKSSKKNNYYFSSISVSGLTPSFDMYKYSYDLHVTGNTTVNVNPVTGASYAGSGSYSLKKGSNKVTLKVKSETGYTMDYVINVDASAACTLTVKSGKATAPSTPSSTVKKGDTNGDGTVTIRDLANIRLHLLKISTLKNDNFKGADTNGDGDITIRDLANVRLHLLGISKLN